MASSASWNRTAAARCLLLALLCLLAAVSARSSSAVTREPDAGPSLQNYLICHLTDPDCVRVCQKLEHEGARGPPSYAFAAERPEAAEGKKNPERWPADCCCCPRGVRC